MYNMYTDLRRYVLASSSHVEGDMMQKHARRVHMAVRDVADVGGASTKHPKSNPAVDTAKQAHAHTTRRMYRFSSRSASVVHVTSEAHGPSTISVSVWRLLLLRVMNGTRADSM